MIEEILHTEKKYDFTISLTTLNGLLSITGLGFGEPCRLLTIRDT